MTDYLAHKFPVSIKGVVIRSEQVILLKNERNEWELPGGKLEAGEQPQACLQREIEEELSIQVDVGRLVGCWLYDIRGVEVLIVEYACTTDALLATARLSAEHKEVGIFSLADVAGLPMPDGYKRAIYSAREIQTRCA